MPFRGHPQFRAGTEGDPRINAAGIHWCDRISAGDWAPGRGGRGKRWRIRRSTLYHKLGELGIDTAA